MQYFIALILAAFAAMIGFLLGLVCFSLGRRLGPSAVRVFGLVGAAAGFLALALLGRATNEPTLFTTGGIIVGAATALSAIWYSRTVKMGIDYQPRIENIARGYGLRNFELLDADGDGLITVEDLRIFNIKSADPDDAEAVRFLWKNMSDVGHWIGSRSDQFSIRQEAPVRTLRILHNVYGISRSDLRRSFRRKQPGKSGSSAKLVA
jgi:hypothetical protein